MDLETIKRINREALEAAKASNGSYSGSAFGLSLDNTHLMVYALAAVVAGVCYYLLQQYQPELVTRVENGMRVFDQTRAIVASVVAGLLVVLAHYLFF